MEILPYPGWENNRLAIYVGRIETAGETSPPMTWASMVQVEPRLTDLEREAAQMGAAVDDADYWRGWEAIKRQLAKLAGWDATQPDLRTPEAWEAAHDRLYLTYSNASAGRSFA